MGLNFAENDLVRRFGLGDHHAFEQVVRRWDTDILNLALRIVGDLEEARDLRQAVFIRAWERRRQFDGRARFSTWLYRIAVNLCRDHLRRRAAQGRLRQRAGERATEVGMPTAADNLARHETQQRVAGAVAALPADLREVVVLRHVAHLSFSDIALIVGAPESTVRGRMRRGLDVLRERLVERDYPQAHSAGPSAGKECSS